MAEGRRALAWALLLAGAAGILAWRLPSVAVETSVFALAPEEAGDSGLAEASKALREDILDVQVPLDAIVARRQLRVRDILYMQPGDVIPVELPEQMLLKANGVPTFEVKLGSHKDMLALQVMGPLERNR